MCSFVGILEPWMVNLYQGQLFYSFRVKPVSAINNAFTQACPTMSLLHRTSVSGCNYYNLSSCCCFCCLDSLFIICCCLFVSENLSIHLLVFSAADTTNTIFTVHSV